MRDWFDAQGYADSNGVMSKAPKSHRTSMKAAIAYYHYVDFYHNEDDILDVTSSLSFINDSGSS
jgi:hypothetical protein